ncbi:GntR family transcriptional regulator [Streptomyces sp. NBC_01477]|uniref:GntR family transcriptional regulator n=1 Tax=Streptomyces sp. NBC_01477 TaxID=2976015 RepID=UPI002E32FC5B|nr:GntR family transcriptional regulator [Streptomyces sp. NBC_01477]
MQQPREPGATAHAGWAPLPAPRRMPERLSVRDQVLDELRDALLAGELPPGSVHSAPVLAARYGVSATPVREAMQLLAREGAVEVLPNRGFRVACHTERDLAQIAEVRMLVEIPVVLALARTLPGARWEALRPLAAAAVAAAAAGERAGYAEADRAFHRAVLGLAGNPHMVAVADDLHRRAQWPATAPVLGGRPTLLAHAAQHDELLTALAGGAPAEHLLRDHLASTP